MSAPVVVGTIAKGGTSVVGDLVLTLTAAAAKGDLVLVSVGEGASSNISAADSKSNTYTSVRVSIGAGGLALLTCVPSVALTVGDTITVHGATSVQLAAVVTRISGASWSMALADRAGTATTGTSTAPRSPAMALSSSDDTLAVAAAGIAVSAAADFTAIDSGYSGIDTAQSAGGAANCSIATAFKQLTAATTMPTQQPTWTLASSRAWSAGLSALSGETSRGALAADLSAVALAAPVASLAMPYTAAEIAALGVRVQGGGVSVYSKAP